MTDPVAPDASALPFEMTVELGKVREFARATGADDPDLRGTDTPISPVTFLMTAAFWQSRDNWPAGVPRHSRVLHGEQRFKFYDSPPRAGTRLRGKTRI